MGLCITLEREDGTAIQMVADDKNVLHRFLPAQDDESFPLLASIDWYGDTVFNGQQMPRFVREWDRLFEATFGLVDEVILAEVRKMALQCRDGVHLYLKFLGD